MASKTNIKPLHDYILIQPKQAETRTASGIVLPESVKEKPQTGTVMAIGEGMRNEKGDLMPMIVKVGDVVIYTKWGGNEIKVGTEEWKLVKQTDVLAVEK
jgi:chaperonin GroES